MRHPASAPLPDGGFALSGLQKQSDPVGRISVYAPSGICSFAGWRLRLIRPTKQSDPVGRISVYAPSGNVFLYLPKYFALQEGGKPEYPRELTEVSDRGTTVQPTHLRRERRR
jgi:hypothetical protein